MARFEEEKPIPKASELPSTGDLVEFFRQQRPERAQRVQDVKKHLREGIERGNPATFNLVDKLELEEELLRDVEIFAAASHTMLRLGFSPDEVRRVIAGTAQTALDWYEEDKGRQKKPQK